MTPAIATVTMVAITVVLAAVVGAAMLGFAGGLRTGGPQVSVDFTYRTAGVGYEVVATVTGGRTITGERTGNVSLVADGGPEHVVPESEYPIGAGDSIVLGEDTGGTVSSGTAVRLVWSSPDGERTRILARGRTPY
ncbi:type IV pilin [Halobaculum sp. CBA1158]|uniref:type IV pilin n=1 Tax=Halobaculum sp. CBA1158 TaxID=2904243 RepID=UPI001F30BFB5|nr:type IV pilin [Halobaculum sp. CBA1158]UIP01149.1 type IV pilin [Halobaculum sp. CBA1158]